MATFDAGSIEASVDLDASPFKRALSDMKREGERFAQNKFSPKLDADDSEAKRKINAIKLQLASLSGTTRVNVDVGNDALAQLDQIAEKRSALDGKGVKLKVSLNGYTPVMRQLAALDKAIDKLEGRDISVTVDANTMASRARLDQLQRQLRQIDGTRVSPQVNTNGLTRATSQSQAAVGSFANLAAAALALGPALIPIGAAALGAAAGLSAVGIAAGAGVGLFAAATMGAVKATMSNQKAVTDTTTALDSAKQAYAATASGITSAQESIRSAQQQYAESQKAARQAVLAVGEAEQKVGEARKNYNAAIKEAATSAAKVYAEGQRSIRDAVLAVGEAEQKVGEARRNYTETLADNARSAQKVYAEGQKEIKEAVEKVGEAEKKVNDARRTYRDALRDQKNAIDAVDDAEEDYANAQADTKRAQEELNQARKDAVDYLRDMNLALKGDKLDEESARIQVARAKEALDEIKNQTNASALDRQEKDLAYREALQHLDETRNRNAENAKEAQEANKKGVEGTDLVKAAKDRLLSTEQASTNSYQALYAAQQNAAKAGEKVADAQRGIADAQEDVVKAQNGVKAASAEAAAKVQEDAEKSRRKVVDAQQDIAEAQQGVVKAQMKVRDASAEAAQRVQEDAQQSREKVEAAQKGIAEAQKGVVQAQEAVKAANARVADSYRNVGQAQQQLVAAQKAQADAARKVAEAQNAANAAAKEFSPVERAFSKQIDNLKKAWSGFIKATEGTTLGVASKGVQAIQVALSKAAPVVKAFGPVFNEIADATLRWTKNGGLDRFFNMVIKIGVPATRNIAAGFRNLLKVGGDMIRAFAPLGLSLTKSFKSATAALANWSGGGGFTRFLDKIRDNAPAIKEFFRALGGALKNVGQAMAGLGPLSLLTATGLLKIIAALPPAALQAIIVAFIAYRAAMMAHAVATNIATIAESRHRLAQIASRVSTMATIIVFRAYRVAILASAAAHRILSAAFLSSPIGWLVLAIAGLVIAFVLLWKKCEGFRNFWKGLWHAIQNGIGVAWNWMRENVFGPLGRFFSETIPRWSGIVKNAVVGAWNKTREGVSGAYGWMRDHIFSPIGNFFTKTIPDAASWLMRAVRNRWHDMQNGVNAVFNWLKQHIFAPIGNFFTKTIPDAASWLMRAVRNRWHDMQNGINAVFNWLKQHIFSPIGNFFRKTIPDAAAWLMRAVRNRWHDMQDGINAVFNWIKRNIFSPLSNFFRKTIPNAAESMGRWVIKHVDYMWNWFHDKWEWVKKKVLNPIGDFFTKKIPGWANKFADLMKDAWGKAVDFIKDAWSRIKKIAADPINFVIKTVYNKGIRPVWNTIAGAVGLDKLKLKEAEEIKFAEGGSHQGRVHGSGTGRSDSVASRYAAGEHVWTAREVQGAGGHQAVARLRSQALGGAPVRGAVGERKQAFADGGALRFDDGGWWGKVKDVAGKVGGAAKKVVKGAGKVASKVAKGVGKVITFGKEFVQNPLGKIEDLIRGSIGVVANPVLDAIKKGITSGMPGKNGYMQIARGMATRPIDWIKEWIKKDDEANSSANGFVPFRDWKAGDGKRVNYGGVTVDSRTAEMLDYAKKLAGHGWSMTQGSFSTGVGASAGTHDGGGVVDIGNPSNTNVGFLRGAGFAAWARSRQEGFSPHMHAVAVGDKLLSPAAKDQVDAFFKGQNGLADHGPDTYVAPGGGKGGNAASYSSIILRVLKRLGESPSNLANVIKAMNKESGGNPKAINNWDSNAKAGIPSKGLMQVIDPTFKAYAGPFKNRSIYDPEANIYAAINYARATYGSGWSARMARPGGYAAGTVNALAGIHRVAENGAELVVKPGLRSFQGGEKVFNARDTAGILGGGNGTDTVYVPTTLVVQMDDKNAFTMTVVDIVDHAVDSADRSR